MPSTFLRRRLLAVIAVAAAVLILFAGIHLPFVRARVFEWARARAAQDLGVIINADALGYNLLGVSIDLENPSFAAPGERPFLQADRVRLRLDRHLFLGTLTITGVDLVRPRLLVVRHGDGRTNLPTVQNESPTPPAPIQIGLVSVKALTAAVEDEAGGHRAGLGPIDLSLDTRMNGSAPGVFGPSAINVTLGGTTGVDRTLSGTIAGHVAFNGERVTLAGLIVDTPDARLTLDGWIDVIAETIRADAKGTLQSDLARARRFIGSAAQSLSGTASAEFTLQGPIANPVLHVAASGKDLHYQSLDGANADLDATYSAGRVDVHRFNLTSNLGTAAANGSIRVAAADGQSENNRLSAHLTNIDLDRVLDTAGIQRPVRLGAVATGDISSVLSATEPFAAGWWRQLTTTGSVQFASTGVGLSVEGRLNLAVEGEQWRVEHHLRSAPAMAALSGVVSGRLTQDASGEFSSSLAGDSSLQAESLRALIPFARQAGTALPPPLDQIDGVATAVLNPGGTVAVPRLVTTLSGQGLRVPNFPEGDLESKATLTRQTIAIESLQAHMGTNTVSASGTYSWAGQIDGRFDVSADDLNSLARLAVPEGVPVSGGGRIIGTVQGTPQALRARAEMTARNLSAYEVDVGALRAQLNLANERVDVDASAPSLNARLQGFVGIREPYSFEAEANLDRSSLATLIPASMREQVPIEGTITITVRSSGRLDRPLDNRHNIVLGTFDATVLGTPVVLDGPATVSVEPDAFTAMPVAIRVGQQTRVLLQGSMGLNDVRNGLDLRLEGPLSDLLAMAAPAMPDTSIEAQESTVTADLHIGGTLTTPRPSGSMNFSAGSLRYAEQPPLTDVSLEARVEPARIAVSSLAAKLLGAAIHGEGEIPLKLIVPDLSAGNAASGLSAWGSRWLASLPAEPRSAQLTAHATGITPDALAPFVDASTLQAVTGNVDVTAAIQADGFAIDQVRGSIVLDRAALVLAEVPFTQSAPTRITVERGQARIDEFRWHADENELRISGNADLVSAERPVNVAIDGDIDLRVLGAFVTDMASGGIAHSQITVKGPLASPEILGTIGVAGGELRLDNPSFAASEIDGTITIPANRNATIALKGTVNGGAATIQGNVSLQDVTKPVGRITLNARNVTLDYPEGFQTESNADLSLTLGATNTLSGQIDVLSGLYREPIVVSRSLLAGLGASNSVSANGEPSFLSTLALDVKVATAEQIRVDNNYGRLNFTANLHVTGTASQPGAVGRIEAESDGEIYLAGNTYRVESLVVDLANPRAIAPELSFLADTRVADVPIEIALQCSASGTCERDVRSQTAGKTNEEAEALLFGVSANTAEAGAQLARLLSGEVLGLVGQSVRLDTLRLEQGASRADLFDDPTLIAGDVNPASRLTLGKRLGDHVELAYSQNLAESGFTVSTSYFGPAGISGRALLLDDQSRTYEFRHEPRLGAARTRRRPTVAGSTISSIRFTGAPGFPEADLHRQLRLTEGDHFTFAAWQADRGRLIAFYQDRGFFEVHVRARRLLSNGEPLESAPDASLDSIALEYAVERGRSTRLEISGFVLPERVRQRIMARWESAIFDGFLERDATLIVREHLLSENRLQATVSATITHDADDSKTLHITIDPGPETMPRLVFEGNAALSTATLLLAAQRAGLTAAWLDPAAFALMLVRLYHDDGFLSAEVTVRPPLVQQHESVVRVVIREGNQWAFGRVSVDGATALPAQSLDARLGLLEDGPYTPKAISDAVGALEQAFRDAGFLNVHVTADTSFDASAQRVNVHVVAESGPRTILSAVAVDGSPEDRETVARSSGLTIDTPISASALAATRRRLYQTGTYKSVDITLEPVTGTAGDARQDISADRRVVAHVHVQERPRFSFRYGAAMNDDVVGPGQRTQKLGFAADLENRNILGLGANLGVSARIRSDQEVGRAFLIAPRFLGLPVRSNLFLSRGRQQSTNSDSEFKTRTTSDVTDVGGEQTWRLNGLFDVRYGYDLGRNQTTFETLDASNSAPIILTVRVARLTTGSLIDRRNDPFDPTHGWFNSTSFELSRPGLGSQISFLRSFVQQFQFVPVGHGMVAASALRLGLARTFRDETLIPNERFFSGGATSIRGYKDNDLGPRSIFDDADGGAALLTGNSELRFPIYRWLKGVGFVDVGNVYSRITDMFHTGVQAGAGGGVRVATPVGLLRFDLAAPLNPRTFDPKWTFHFGLGHAF